MEKQAIFDLITDIGDTILTNGGEITRTKDTMERLAAHFEIQDFSTYIVSNGIFTSAVIDGNISRCRILNVALSPIYLCRVEAANQLSRELVNNHYSPEDAVLKLEEIRAMTTLTFKKNLLFSGIGCAAFCFIFDGTLLDMSVSFFGGMLLALFTIFATSRINFSKIMMNLLGSMLVTLFSCIMYSLGIGNQLNMIIIGGIFPLIPGVPFTNGLQNIFNDDYLSGIIKIVDAILVAACIAVGVGLTLWIWDYIPFLMGVPL